MKYNCLDCRDVVNCKKFNPNRCEKFERYTRKYETPIRVAQMCGISARTIYRKIRELPMSKLNEYIRERSIDKNITISFDVNGMARFLRG